MNYLFSGYYLDERIIPEFLDLLLKGKDYIFYEWKR